MRILVTGAGGLLGRALVERLGAQPEHTLHVTDLKPAPAGTFHSCNLLEAGALDRLVQEVRPHQIYHLAGTFANDYSQDFPINVEATRHLLECVRQTGQSPRVLLIGSAAEYGCVAAEANPVRETQPLAPVSIYGWTKACQSLLMHYYHRVHGLDLVMARLFNLTGSGASNQLLVGRVEEQIECLLAGTAEHITLGNLDASRDYLPVEEAARQLDRVMRFGRSGEVYHVASGRPTQLRHLLGELLRARGLSPDCVRETPRTLANKLDVPIIYADVSKTSGLPEIP
jgi:GDP-4-dehydro-6-deoxy-D-mannose reductase